MASGKANFNNALRLFNDGKLEDAKHLLRKITRTHKHELDPWLLLGMAEARCANYEKAATCFRKILSISPTSADAHYYLGAALEAQHFHAEAIDELKAALRHQQKYPKAYYSLGNIHRQLGFFEESENYYRLALEQDPEYFEALNNLGSLLKVQSNFDGAINCFTRALKIRTGDAGVLTNIANTYHLMYEYDLAEQYYERALAVNPKLSEAIIGLSGALFSSGNKGKALSVLAAAKRELPNDETIVASEAVILEEDGQYAEAYRVLENHIASKSDCIEVANSLARLSRRLDLTEQAIEMLQRLEKTSVDVLGKMNIYFTLGELFDSQGRYDDAFNYFSKANQLKPVTFERLTLRSKINKQIQIFSDDFLSTAPRSGDLTDKPVFVIGMPRSGTSLVEQILASHSKVYGAGELMDLGIIAASLGGNADLDNNYPNNVKKATKTDLDEAAKRYTAKLDSLAPGAARIIDKMPANYLHLGSIELMFPNARVIHCTRHPLDTCLSCYFNDFLGYHPYSYDLANLGFYYCEYLRLMKHWIGALKIPIYTVEYEALINDQEQVSRNLLEFCGLEWESQCLNFYKTKRLVKTASYHQVKQPIYTTSVARYEHYIDKLGGLIDELNKCQNEWH